MEQLFRGSLRHQGMTTKTLLGTLALALAAGGTLFGIAGAGLRASSEVFFATTYFSGGLRAVANSADSTQYIGCYTTDENYGACFARNAAGNGYRSCSFNNVALANQVRSISEAAYIRVAYDTSSGACTSIRVEHLSYNQ